MISVLLKLGGLQSIILGFLNLSRKQNHKANSILAILLFILGLSSLFYSVNDLEVYLEFPHLIRLNWGLPLLFGPLILLYTKAFINPNFRINQNDLWYFLPYCLNLTFLLPFFLKSGEAKIQILNYFTANLTRGIDNYAMYHSLMQLAIAIISIQFSVRSLNQVKAYQKSILNNFSEIEKIKLNWLKVIIYSFLVVFTVFTLVFILTYRDLYPDFDYEVYFYLALFVLIYFLSYKSFQQIPFNSSIGEEKKSTENLKAPSNSQLQKELAKRLIDYMDKERPYLNGQLTASELAAALQMNRHQLSLVLNEHLGQSFYDFINTYRIKAFKEHLQNPQNAHLTLLGLAFESGFNSKTAFNSVFKKLEGMTPREFKKQIEQQERKF